MSSTAEIWPAALILEGSVATPVAIRMASGLDTDNFGAIVGQNCRRLGSGQDPGEVEHPDAAQWTFIRPVGVTHVLSPFACPQAARAARGAAILRRCARRVTPAAVGVQASHATANGY